MEYVNLNLVLPIFTYLRLENLSKEIKSTKNEIIIEAILWLLDSNGKGLCLQKNARLSTDYNKKYKGMEFMTF